MGDRSIRASDADRERVARILRDHAVVGRLTTEDLDERTASPQRSHARRTRRPRVRPSGRTAARAGAACGGPHASRAGRPLGAGRRRHRDDRDSVGARLDRARLAAAVAARRSTHNEPERCAQVRKTLRPTRSAAARMVRSERRRLERRLRRSEKTIQRCRPTILTRSSSTVLRRTRQCAASISEAANRRKA